MLSTFVFNQTLLLDSAGKKAFGTIAQVPNVPKHPSAAQGTYGVFDLQSNQNIWRKESGGMIFRAAASSDLGIIALIQFRQVGQAGELLLLDGLSGNQRSAIQLDPDEGAYFQISPDGKRMVLVSHSGRIAVMDTAKPAERHYQQSRNLALPISATFSSDSGRLVLIGRKLGRAENTSLVQVWNLHSASLLSEKELPNTNGGQITLSGDGKLVAIAADGGDLLVWNYEKGTTQRLVALQDGKLGIPFPEGTIAFSRDQRLLFSPRMDGIVVVWDLARGTWIAQLGAMPDGTWFVVDSTGRFDSNNVSGIGGVRLVQPSDPTHSVSLDTLDRNAFKSGLLAALIGGAPPQVNASTATTYPKPSLAIEAIRPTKGVKNQVDVTVRIEPPKIKSGPGAVSNSLIHEVFLFRWGQLVRALSLPQDVVRDIREGRDRTITFSGVGLVGKLRPSTWELSVYGFADDGSKTDTVRTTYKLQADPNPEKGRAYIISVGVGTHQNPAWDIMQSATDARLLNERISSLARSSNVFDDVVSVVLVSDGKASEVLPTKQTIKSTLDRLSGRDPVSAKGVASILDTLRRATVNDVILITFSSHGLVDSNDNFYLMTQDNGSGSTGEQTQEVIRRSISSQELATWLSDIDSTQIAT